MAERGHKQETGARRGFHRHVHRHEADAAHRHPHHHAEPTGAAAISHDHAHAPALERLTYIVSPVHELDPRAKALSTLAMAAGIVIGAQLRLAEALFCIALLGAVTALARLPLKPVLLRSLLVLPFAAGVAAFSPLASIEQWSIAEVARAYREGWPIIADILAKSWLSASTVVLLASTTSPSRLFAGLSALHTPRIFVTMLTFLYRYVGVMAGQVQSMRRSLASRAPGLKGRRLLGLYGRLAGNLFVRAYERGERVHAAMLSRGYDGTLPTADRLHWRSADTLVLTTAIVASLALALY